jgi:hypothetical protein
MYETREQMEPLTMQRIRGAKVLMEETIEALVIAIAEAHQDIAHLPYAVLEQVEVIATPLRAIEQVQQGITIHVYQAIRAMNQIVGIAATQLLDQLEAQEKRQNTVT